MKGGAERQNGRKHHVNQGERYGRWLVVGDEVNSRNDWYVPCLCDCGNQRMVSVRQLGVGKSRSCGCLTAELAKTVSLTHGETGTRLYNTWCNLIRRCENPNTPDFERYGGRGIRVCQEWRNSYETFRDWALANGFSPNLEIDRRDNNGGYAPDNCRRITKKANTRNRRSNIPVTAWGETKLAVEWSEDSRCRVDYGTLYSRLQHLRWNPETAIATPPTQRPNSLCKRGSAH